MMGEPMFIGPNAHIYAMVTVITLVGGGFIGLIYVALMGKIHLVWIPHLRKQDRDYFGPRVGRGSAIHTILAVLFGIMPLSFARGRRISAADVIKMWENDKLVWERGKE